jgi:protocatechuate 3,4-dioxygenase beta subunit
VRVVDEDGNPLVGARVVVWDTEGTVVASGVTDDLGVFRFQAVYGEYRLRAERGGYQPSEAVIRIPESLEETIVLEAGS